MGGAALLSLRGHNVSLEWGPHPPGFLKGERASRAERVVKMRRREGVNPHAQSGSFEPGPGWGGHGFRGGVSWQQGRVLDEARCIRLWDAVRGGGVEGGRVWDHSPVGGGLVEGAAVSREQSQKPRVIQEADSTKQRWARRGDTKELGLSHRVGSGLTLRWRHESRPGT